MAKACVRVQKVQGCLLTDMYNCKNSGRTHINPSIENWEPFNFQLRVWVAMFRSCTDRVLKVTLAKNKHETGNLVRLDDELPAIKNANGKGK
jgi:hypothetical protein